MKKTTLSKFASKAKVLTGGQKKSLKGGNDGINEGNDEGIIIDETGAI